MADAHRALELLEDYHSRLTKPQDRPLRNAIERVIRIFKSRLFQALLGMSMVFIFSTFCPWFKGDTSSVLKKLLDCRWNVKDKHFRNLEFYDWRTWIEDTKIEHWKITGRVLLIFLWNHLKGWSLASYLLSSLTTAGLPIWGVLDQGNREPDDSARLSV